MIHARGLGRRFGTMVAVKVALARALLHEPDVLFLDEPTTGLDPLGARAVRELIVGLKHASRSIVVCTHDLDEAERLADTVAILRQGRLVAHGTSEALRAAVAGTTLVQVALAAPCSAAVPIASGIDGVSEPCLVVATGSILTYRTVRPDRTNPAVVAALVAVGAAVVSVTCTAATLQDVYAAALSPAAESAIGGGA